MDQTRPPKSLPPRSPTRPTSAPTWPHYEYSKQRSLPVNPYTTHKNDGELFSPCPTTPKQNIIQLSPPVNPTPQRLQRNKHKTTCLTRKPQIAHTHTRKRSYPTHIATHDREPTKTNLPPETQQPAPSHKIKRDPKRTKTLHHATTTKTTLELCTPTHNTPHITIPNPTHPISAPLPTTCPKPIQSAIIPPTITSSHHQTHHHISSPNAN